MTEHVPLPDAQRAAELTHVGGVVLDSRLGRVDWRAAFPAPALVVQNQLSAFRQRSKRRPQHSMSEEHTAIDRDERRATGDGRRGKNREDNSSGAHRLAIE